ncbi:MAG: hypothetical protein MK135_07850, partial [Polyangiaceae bacterium]|nr:hypothetical protein [Polyangiaceae bacterium]
TTSLRTRRSSITAAAVSSQEVSIPRIITISPLLARLGRLSQTGSAFWMPIPSEIPCSKPSRGILELFFDHQGRVSGEVVVPGAGPVTGPATGPVKGAQWKEQTA